MSIAGAISENPDTSRYASRQAAKYAQQAAEKEQTLGTTGKLVAGIGKYAPAIGAGIINPYAGAGVSGLLVTGDVLGTQYDETGEYNLPKAAAAGTLAAGADLATMGHYRDWETDRKSTRLNSRHSAKSRMPSSA